MDEFTKSLIIIKSNLIEVRKLLSYFFMRIKVDVIKDDFACNIERIDICIDVLDNLSLSYRLIQ